jgi:hypothetical protein
MKQLAARDYEDMLQVCGSSPPPLLLHRMSHNPTNTCLPSQCAIPVFEGLLDDDLHNKRVLSLLFILAHWHGLAKLHTHTDHTLKILDEKTTDLGSAFRTFIKDVCQNVNTQELKRESEARKRREAKKSQQKTNKPAAPKKAPPKKKGKPSVAKKGTRAAANTRGKSSSSKVVDTDLASDDNLSDEPPEADDLPPPAKKRKVDSAGKLARAYPKCLNSRFDHPCSRSPYTCTIGTIAGRGTKGQNLFSTHVQVPHAGSRRDQHQAVRMLR